MPEMNGGFIMASPRRNVVAIAAVLLAVALPGGQSPSFAQNAPITTPPKVMTPPLAVMPDLVAAMAWTIKLKCVGTSSVTAIISATLHNNGNADADLTKHPFHHIVTAQLLAIKVPAGFPFDPNQVVVSPGAGPAVLKAGSSAKITVTMTNIPPATQKFVIPIYRFSLIVDPTNLVAEAREDNNVLTKQVQNTCIAFPAAPG
jgi:hypothetical protein